MRRLFVPFLVSGGLVLSFACSSHKVKLEMTREVNVIPPTISGIAVEPSGRLNTYGQGREVTVTMKGDPALAASFDVPGRVQNYPMKETSPGVYTGTFRVNADERGTIPVIGHLLHQPSGARQEARNDQALELYVEGPPPAEAAPAVAGGCTPDMAKEFEARLRPVVVLFDFNRHEINPRAREVLMGAKDIVESHPECALQLHGHTDEIGTEQYNLALSDERAEAVSRFLQQVYQIPASRLTTQGHGKSKPVDTAGTDASRARNRRVELHTVPSN